MKNSEELLESSNCSAVEKYNRRAEKKVKKLMSNKDYLSKSEA